MNPLILLFLLSKLAHGAKHQPSWPTPRHPPPRRPAPAKMPAPPPPVPVAETHMEPHHEPVPEHHQAEPVHETHAEPTPLRVVHTAPEPPPAPSEPDVFSVPVEKLQRILVALGWRGDNTTDGRVQPSLSDGLWGPVTAGDWRRSAVKRGLDPTIERIGPQLAHVDPHTYATLRQLVAQRGVVVGEGGRRLRIP